MARAKLADSVVYLSEGIPAIQLGQEFLRTKGGNGNSYNAGDAANAIDWNRAAQYADSVDYVKGSISRKQIKALRLTNYDDINDSVTMLKSDEWRRSLSGKGFQRHLHGDLQRQRARRR